MLRRIRNLGGAVLVALSALFIVFLLGMRKKSPTVLNAVRRMNRAVSNPRQMESAGQPGAYASVIHHVGRTSGTPYETPIVVVPSDETFVVALPYGTNADWLKNMLASGTATIVSEGKTYSVDQPEIIPIDAAASYFSAKDQQAHRLFGVVECLRVRRAETRETA